jgi:hypothetical protein
MYTYPIGWILGLPSVAIYERLGIYSLRSYVVGGLVGGTLVAMILVAWPSFDNVVTFAHEASVPWLPIGFAAAAGCASFWMIAIRRRHDAT